MVVRILLFLSIWLATMSCAQDAPDASIHFDLSSLQDKDIEVFNIPSQVSMEISPDKDSLSLQLEKELVLNVKSELGYHYIYLHPYESLKMGSDESAPLGFGVLGELSTENKYLVEFQKTSNEQMDDFIVNIDSLAQLSAVEYSNEINKKNSRLRELVYTIQNDPELSGYFKNAIQHRFIATITNDLSYYKSFYFNFKKEYPSIPDDFYELFASTDITDEAFLLFQEGREVIKFYPSRETVFRDFDSQSDYFKSVLTSADSVYGRSLTDDYFAYDQITTMVDYLSIDEVLPFVTTFKNSTEDKFLVDRLDKKLSSWLELVSGKPAPDFKGMTPDGKEVSLSDLKGKKVYIDIWATWCGPCLAEIPYLKELEEEMRDENIEFVSVSIDEAMDKDKWKDYIKRKELTGLQLFAEGAWNSDIVKRYNITNIPRFLLIGEDGKIINSTAPRPSSGTLKNILSN